MAQYPNGLDFVWIASDRDGHVGAFITAGVGPIPAGAFRVDHFPVEDIEAHLCRLPVVSPCRLLVRVSRPDSFVALCERGLFVYDWTDVHRSINNATRMYELIAVPATPLHSDQLPAGLQIPADKLRLPTVSFGKAASVDIRSILTCIEAR